MSTHELPFTIFTPTYNRAYTLQRVFDSLLGQTLKTEDGRPVFEWLIVDDGSTDDTAALVREFEARADFPLRYVAQANKGKHVAINRGVELARGELFIIADSDDAFVPETMAVFAGHWRSLDQDQRASIFGITSLVRDGYRDELIGRVPPGAPGLTDTIYMTYMARHKLYAEGWGAIRTAALRRFPFPEPEGARFVPLTYVWDELYFHYGAFVTGDVLRIVYFEQDGFTRNPILNFVRDARERYAFHLKRLNRYGDIFWKFDKRRYLKDAGQLGRMQLHAGYGLTRALGDLTDWRGRIIALLLLPFSVFFYWRDRRVIKSS